MNTVQMTKAKTRVLDTAQNLFNQHGYNSVSMRDIADGLGMKQSSLYYHVPDGKEQLYVEVTKRCLEAHFTGITDAISRFNDLETQLQAISRWFFSRPALHLFNMMEHDMAELSSENQHYLKELAYQSLFMPLIEAFEDAVARDEIRFVDPEQFAGMFLTIIEGVSFAHRNRHSMLPLDTMADQMIDVLMNGLRPQETAE